MSSLAPEPVDRAVLDAVRAPFAAYARNLHSWVPERLRRPG